MSRQGVGRIVSQGRSNTRYLTIPSGVASDSNFPFVVGEAAIVTIVEGGLSVRKVTDSEKMCRGGDQGSPGCDGGGSGGLGRAS